MKRRCSLRKGIALLLALVLVALVLKYASLLRMSNEIQARHSSRPLQSYNQDIIHDLPMYLYSYTQGFSNAITDARNTLNTLNLTIKLINHSKTVYNIGRTFPIGIEKLVNLRTVFVNMSKALYLGVLPQRWYVCHSSNCTALIVLSRAVPSHPTPKCLQAPFNSVFNYTDMHSLDRSTAMFRAIIRSGAIKNISPHPDKMTVSFVHIIRDGIVYPGGDVVTNGALLSVGGCNNALAEAGNEAISVKTLPTYKGVFTISQYYGSNFYHFTIENLPRLILVLPFLHSNKDIKIHVTKKQVFMKPFLKELGLSDGRLVEGALRAQTVYVPPASACGKPSALPVNMLSHYLRSTVTSTARTSIVLIRRSQKRWFNHHKSILVMLRKVAKMFHLADVEVFSDRQLPSYDVTRRTFHRAIVVVAPHGAGLANMIFSQPGTCVVEGLCHDSQGKVNLCFRDLARVLGHVYHGVVTSRQCMYMTSQDLHPHVFECLLHVLGFQ